jgi:hypothetical protein
VIYLLIRCHGLDGKGQAFPSRNTLAKEALCAPESVSRSTAKLEKLKLIRKDWRRSQAFTVYELLDEQVTNWSLERIGHNTSGGIAIATSSRIEIMVSGYRQSLASVDASKL